MATRRPVTSIRPPRCGEPALIAYPDVADVLPPVNPLFLDGGFVEGVGECRLDGVDGGTVAEVVAGHGVAGVLAVDTLGCASAQAPRNRVSRWRRNGLPVPALLRVRTPD